MRKPNPRPAPGRRLERRLGPAVAWLLRFIAGHTYTIFIAYRIALGTIVLILVASGAVAAT